MTYLWELMLQIYDQGIDPDSLRFVPSFHSNPYMELAREDINAVDIQPDEKIEINPYFRFYKIFGNLFSPDLEEYQELRMGLFHLIMHMLVENDLLQGMNKNEYYKQFLYKDIMNEAYGLKLSDSFRMFSKNERDLILSGLLKLYSAGDSLELLKEIMAGLFANLIIYHNKSNVDEVLLYIGEKKTSYLMKKVDLVLQLFAGIRYTVQVYYEYHFAILGVNATCLLDEIALY